MLAIYIPVGYIMWWAAISFIPVAALVKVYRYTRYVFIIIFYDRFEKEVDLKPWRIDLEIKS